MAAPAMISWRRVLFALVPAVFVGMLLSPGSTAGFARVLGRAVALAMFALVVFGALERWPRRAPFARWVLQVAGVALAIPVGTTALYLAAGVPRFWDEPGFLYLTVLSMMISPWMALGALVRQKDVLAREQALSFALERSELERQAQGARLRLLQAQVAPHFLFNSLANVQALVDAGSPRASSVLRSLTAYLRAAVPRMDRPVSTLGDELDLVEAYLSLMQLRMPDRLAYAVTVDGEARSLRCPPIALLTLVENAVRHGIDPSEDGGRIDVEVSRDDRRCWVRVRDTGVGLGGGTGGTGLAALRERLQLVFGDAAALRIAGIAPHGVCAELDLPVAP